MGFEVYRVRNELIKSAPSNAADNIIQKYYEVVDAEDKSTKVTRLKATEHQEPIPKDIRENLQLWAIEFNKELNDEKWLADYFKESLTRFHPGFVANQCAIEKLILLLLGLNLHKDQNGSSIDFEYSSNLLKKGIEICRSVPSYIHHNSSLMYRWWLSSLYPNSAMVITLKPLSYRYFISLSNSFTSVLDGSVPSLKS